MMRKPWIGIPTRFQDKNPTGKIRLYLDPILWAGGLPVMIPTFVPPAEARDYIGRLDGILLPGSPTDIDPARYGQAPDPRLGKLFPEREALDFMLLEQGEKAGLPILGICFGAQSLNVYRGGGLVQDIPSRVSNAVHHDDIEGLPGSTPQPARHLVRLSSDGLLARIAGRGALEVNSFHHQAVQAPGTELRVVATAPDGVVEAVEDARGRFVLGIQWHPEREFLSDEFSQALFTEFVRQSAASQSRNHPV